MSIKKEDVAFAIILIQFLFGTNPCKSKALKWTTAIYSKISQKENRTIGPMYLCLYRDLYKQYKGAVKVALGSLH